MERRGGGGGEDGAARGGQPKADRRATKGGGTEKEGEGRSGGGGGTGMDAHAEDGKVGYGAIMLRGGRMGGALWELRNSRSCINACSLPCIEPIPVLAGRQVADVMVPPPGGMNSNSRTREFDRGGWARGARSAR